MAQDTFLAMEQVFATTELFDYILSFILGSIHNLTDQEDPRSVKTHYNAKVLIEVLKCSRVNRSWHHHILGSKYVQRALFLAPDPTTTRNWIRSIKSTHVSSIYKPPSSKAPMLNPVIQTTFPSYNFRFCWNSSSHDADTSRETKHCAFLIITKRDLPHLPGRHEVGGQGRRLSEMLLAQPPCTRLEAKIYEEIDDMKEYVGRTTSLDDPVISCEEGLTLGIVHRRVQEMFEKHTDVVAINLTTT